MSEPNYPSADYIRKLLIEQSPDGIIYTDTHGIVKLWNKAAEDFFGYLSKDIVGESLDLIIPEHLRKAHWKGFHEAISSGQTKHRSDALRTRATHKNGNKLYCTLAFSVIKGDEGEVIGAMATARKYIPTPTDNPSRK